VAVLIDLAYAYAASRNDVAAAREIERGAALPSMREEDSFLGTRLVIALSSRGRAQIEEVYAGAQHTPTFVSTMMQHLDDPAAARVLLAKLAQDPAFNSAVGLTVLATWASYYDDPELALDLLSRDAFSNQDAWMPAGLIWLPLMRDVRALPGFSTVVRRIGLVELWNESGWPEFCAPTVGDDFACR
jgi:hypothetical protein